MLFTVLLTACGGTPTPATNPGGQVQTGDGFQIKYSPEPAAFSAAVGTAQTLTIGIDITNPNLANVKVSVSNGDKVSVSPSSHIVADNGTLALTVTVDAAASAGDDPFFWVYIEGVDTKDTPLTAAKVQKFQWTLQ